ncbi:MAG: hypothetical protein K2J72_01935 [Oscillospiraceae bacterium]|nr:hypothetical protein [Oscillospiraceae bacterium]
MNFRKLKKAAAAVLAAAMCVTMAFGTSVSAEEQKSAWSEAKALTSAKYSSKYINWLKKYGEKEAKNTVTYSKSRTKELIDKIDTKLSKDGAEFSFYLIDKESILAAARKDDKFKVVMFTDDASFNIAIYADKTTDTTLVIEDKLKLSDKAYYDYTPEYSYLALAEILDPDVKDDAKGKLFKFKSEDKIYYYEEFESSVFGPMRYLFSEKGTPLAIGVADGFFCMSLSYTVDDSEFKIPEEYKEADIDELIGLLEKLKE